MLSDRLGSMPHYMHKRGSLFVNCLVITLLINNNGSFGQDILFPNENDTVIRHRVHEATTEKFIKTENETVEQCGQNMVLDNGYGMTMGFCECLEGYMYYQKLDECYPVYTKGPCKDGYYFVLRANETVAKCIPNPCKSDNEVLYEGSCYALLSSSGPCPPDLSLVISETTYEPACEGIRAVSYQVITAPLKPCAPGSRRAGRGLCRTIL